jgi:Protein of unknown function (DUF3219)
LPFFILSAVQAKLHHKGVRELTKEVVLNDRLILVNRLTIDTEFVKNGKKHKKIALDFKVSSRDYHDITTLLYENWFVVKVPSENLEFTASIHTYSTSLTNLYEEGAVGGFQLELVEVFEQ